MNKSPVLVVEEDADLAALIADAVDALLYQAYPATSVSDALRLLSRQHFVLILADYIGSRGQYLRRWPILPLLARFAPLTPIVAISALGEVPGRARIAGVLPLPFDGDDLARILQRHALPDPAPSRDPYLAQYLAALWDADPDEAARILTRAGAAGWSPAAIDEDILTPAMYEIGEWWETDGCSVADEHVARAITERMMALIDEHAPKQLPNGRSILIATLPLDRHELGPRMAADFFRWDGWAVRFPGADTPAADLVDEARLHQPAVVGLSATITPDPQQLKSLIAALRAAGVPRVILGGQAFLGLDTQSIAALGADACAPTATAGVALANQFFTRAAGA